MRIASVVAPAFVDTLTVPTSASVDPLDPRTALDEHDWRAVRVLRLQGKRIRRGVGLCIYSLR